MITLNAICLNWAIQQERMKELAVTTASDRKQILSLLLGNMQMHYTYSECQLPDIMAQLQISVTYFCSIGLYFLV